MKKLSVIAMVLLIAALTYALSCASFADDSKLTIGNVSGDRGESVELTVNVSGNPGFNAMSLKIEYDHAALRLTSAELGDICSSCSPSFDNLPYVTFYGPRDIVKNGVVLKLTFEILSGAEYKEYAVSISYDKGNISNLKEDDVDFTIVSGSITVAIAQCVHDYKEVVTKPTCTEGGYTTYTCSKCGDSYTGNETGKLGHSYKAVVTNPTCTEGGYTTYTCSRCGDSYTGSETGKLGHDYKAAVTKPTCTEGGYTTYTCSRCDESYTDNDIIGVIGRRSKPRQKRRAVRRAAPVRVAAKPKPEQSHRSGTNTY